MGERAYLDHNATTTLRPAAAEAMTRALALVGNPSSIHTEGRAARAAIERARHQVAAAVGAEAKNVVFTSGATEALNTLLRPPAGTHLYGATEHDAVRAVCGDASLRLPVDTNGVIDLDAMRARLADTRGVTIALQLANSETGVIQPVGEIATIAKQAGATFVCDATCAFGKIAVDIAGLGVDALVLSAHKFGGPKGVGAIVLNGLAIQAPLIMGGGQEMRRRSGTENVPGIAGMGAAADEAAAQIETEGSRLESLRARLLAGLRAARPDLVVFGEKAPRLPNTLNIGLPGLKSETAVIAVDLAGLAISSGSACSSGKVSRSHVLEAMGVSRELADGALRFSLGWTTTEAEIEQAIHVFARVAGAARHGVAA